MQQPLMCFSTWTPFPWASALRYWQTPADPRNVWNSIITVGGQPSPPGWPKGLTDPKLIFSYLGRIAASGRAIPPQGPQSAGGGGDGTVLQTTRWTSLSPVM
jgi:hypothetical protein